MKKHITMTYIEVLEGMLQRKRETIKVVSSEILASPDSMNKKKFIELGAEISMLETCLDLAKVMFDGKENENTGEKG
ncbi:MAG: hypothetical protein LBP85_10465 [Prevotellaceae bacterium]|jgi:spore coat polysaccharide biosynthesis predicted glycosyltransferase SpsG|nr:hypothetical protein [Prevotellaceae bacterium]